MKKLILAPAALILTFAAHFAMAQGMAAMTFAGIDTDSDGALSAEEVAALPFVQNGNISAEQIMSNWDADSDGSISEEEFDNRPQGMGGGMGMGA